MTLQSVRRKGKLSNFHYGKISPDSNERLLSNQMRIGIITMLLHTNYGGLLQNFALQTILKRMGHEVVTIDKKRNALPFPLWKVPIVYGKRLLVNLLGRKTPIFKEYKLNRERPILEQHTLRFQEKYIQKKIYDDFSDITPNEYDAFVVGSDQIWRPYYADKAYLKFAENWDVKRIAYAPSFGKDEWTYTPKQTKACGRLLKMFDAVSVREKSGVALCKEHFNVVALHVLDPTMLLDTEDYIKLYEAAHIPKSPGTLLVYILDETHEKEILVQQISKEKGLKPFRVNSQVYNYKAALNERIQPPVEQWLRGFYDAEFVVTDSFHGCVFSILFRRPFVVFGNERNGMARFYSLLSTFGLQERLDTDPAKIKYLEEIDWDSVYEKLSKQRALSMDFLLAACQKS